MREKIKNNTGTMYLIQRKADGFFYRNGGGYISVPEAGWSSQVAACRPFKTIGGAKTSSGWNDWKTVLTNDACEDCKTARYSNHNHTFSERYFGWSRGRSRKANVNEWMEKHNGKAPCLHTSRMSEEENPRRIVPVRIQLALV